MLSDMFVSLTTTSLDPLTLEPLPPETRQRLLRFPLGYEDSALLLLEQITEIIRVDVADILPVPEMPSCVLGICHWRGEMLWLVDLNELLGCTPLALLGSAPATLTVIVIQLNNQALGLVVQKVNDVELHDLQRLQPAASGLFPPKLLPFVLGALPGDNGTVLNVKAIAACPLWQIHRRGAIT